MQDIGGAIALFGGQLVTTVCTTYAIESYPEDTTHVSAFLTVVRQTFSFVRPSLCCSRDVHRG